MGNTGFISSTVVCVKIMVTLLETPLMTTRGPPSAHGLHCQLSFEVLGFGFCDAMKHPNP